MNTLAKYNNIKFYHILLYMINTINTNRIIHSNNINDINNTIVTLSLPGLIINYKIINLQLKNFLLDYESNLLINYANILQFKGNSIKKPTKITIKDTLYSLEIERRLATLGIAYGSVINWNNNDYKYHCISPYFDIYLQSPGDLPEHRFDKLPSEYLRFRDKYIIMFTGILYLSAYQKGKTQIYLKNNDNTNYEHKKIHELCNLYNGSLFIFDARKLYTKEGMTNDIKYYMYIDIIFEKINNTNKIEYKPINNNDNTVTIKPILKRNSLQHRSKGNKKNVKFD